uniref:Uncharacterized protein n=1 Tax=Panagrolaimus sp. PS1159 TaxID=55785 RepID=A0AC35FDI5_9BILA
MGLFKLKFKVLYQLQIPSARMKMLKLYECYEERFAFVGHEYMKLNYYIKKIRDNYIEIVVENPMGLEIQGKCSDFKHEAADSADINLPLSIVFDPDVLNKSHQNLEIQSASQLHSAEDFEGNDIQKKVSF